MQGSWIRDPPTNHVWIQPDAAPGSGCELGEPNKLGISSASPGRLRWETKPNISIIHLQQQEIPQPGQLETQAQEGEAIWEQGCGVAGPALLVLKARGDRGTSGPSEAPDPALGGQVTTGTPQAPPAPQTPASPPDILASLPPPSSPAARWAEPQAVSRGSQGGSFPAVHEAQPNPKNNVFIL